MKNESDKIIANEKIDSAYEKYVKKHSQIKKNSLIIS